jgi:hypothetical protein
MKQAQAANGDGFEEVDDKGALLYESLEPSDGHLVESAFDFAEAGGAVAADVRPPGGGGGGFC